MRMWLCDPRILCQKHLCGEHLEMHMFLGALREGKKIDGYLTNNLFEPSFLWKRHEDLKDEMISRGYSHKSEMISEDTKLILEQMSQEKFTKKINKEKALKDLLDRCPECFHRFLKL